MVVVATLMGSRYFGGGLAKVGGSPVWAARPWDTLITSYNFLSTFILILLSF
jgi:hypothetical protein